MEILNDGAAIKVVNGSQSRNVLKAQIKIVEVIKTDIIKIDIGAGALGNIFAPFSSVTNPATASPDALKEAILAMLPTSVGSAAGAATEAKQDNTIVLLNLMRSTLTDLKNLGQVANEKSFYEPSMVDDTGAKLVYRGYAPVATGESQPQWAIERVRIENGVEVHAWADGDKNFDNVWADRESLTYR